MFLKKERVWFVLSEEVLCSATSQVYCQEKWETLFFLVSSATSSRNNRELIITLMSKLEKHIVSNSSRESSSI